MKKEIDKIFEKKREKAEEKEKAREELVNFLLHKLKSLYSDAYLDVNISDDWDVEVYDETFNLIQKHGRIDLKEIADLYDIYKAYGFSLNSISDYTTRKNREKGLIFYFKKTEDLDEDEKGFFISGGKNEDNKDDM